jgi:GMP synthase-like glutamine amidotransferase
MRLRYCQHVDFEGLGTIGLWAKDRGHDVAATRLFEGEALPSPDAYDFLVVMGGPMNIYEEEKHPWLATEKDGLKKALDAGKPILGVCLGAQLLADALGAKVTKNAEPEIGWWHVTLTPEAAQVDVLKGMPETFKAYHWHGDSFDIPTGAVHIAQSEACENQGFAYDGRVIGLQFHLETSPSDMLRLIKNCRQEILPDRKYVMPEKRMHELRPNFNIIKDINYAFLDRIAEKYGA